MEISRFYSYVRKFNRFLYSNLFVPFPYIRSSETYGIMREPIGVSQLPGMSLVRVEFIVPCDSDFGHTWRSGIYVPPFYTMPAK